jgi:hypothetical protein
MLFRPEGEIVVALIDACHADVLNGVQRDYAGDAVPCLQDASRIVPKDARWSQCDL